MKRLSLILLTLLVIESKAQDNLFDNHSLSQLFVRDYQTNQPVLVNSDESILFKDALLDLIYNTDSWKMLSGNNNTELPAVILQMDPGTVKGYKVTIKSADGNLVLATYLYNTDQNNLSWFDPSFNKWEQELITGNNMYNLQKCEQYSKMDNAGKQNYNDITTTNTPPVLPEYEQPVCNNDGYIWQPGYWSYNMMTMNYFWVPGVWVSPPSPGLYWTPGYWGFEAGYYRLNPGYWGPSVGYYGGINYGFGYSGTGYYGGEWIGGRFNYNTLYVHVNTEIIHTTYVRPVYVPVVMSARYSFNGTGGVILRPTNEELVYMHRPHILETHEQIIHRQIAATDRSQYVNVNHGIPAHITMDRVNGNAYSNRGQISAQSGRSNIETNRSENFNRNASPNMQNSVPAAINRNSPVSNTPVSRPQVQYNTQRYQPAVSNVQGQASSNSNQNNHPAPANNGTSQVARPTNQAPANTSNTTKPTGTVKPSKPVKKD